MKIKTLILAQATALTILGSSLSLAEGIADKKGELINGSQPNVLLQHLVNDHGYVATMDGLISGQKQNRNASQDSVVKPTKKQTASNEDIKTSTDS